MYLNTFWVSLKIIFIVELFRFFGNNRVLLLLICTGGVPCSARTQPLLLEGPNSNEVINLAVGGLDFCFCPYTLGLRFEDQGTWRSGAVLSSPKALAFSVTHSQILGRNFKTKLLTCSVFYCFLQSLSIFWFHSKNMQHNLTLKRKK